MELEISDKDIELTEELLLPDGAHFPEDAKIVIRCWHSTDVEACPGSGKTTVLLAKLKLLADRMPFINGAGICVLSHTNVAVDEIKSRLSGYADRLLSYPNYIGTIQSFVDKFVTMPYLRNVAGRNVQAVDNLTYAQHMLSRMKNNEKYRSLNYVIMCSVKTHSQFVSRIDYIKELYIREDGSLCVGRQKKALAGASKESTKQYHKLIDELLRIEGIIRYQDAFLYVESAIDNLPETYTDLFSARFQYVFIDEYQDCNDAQRSAIDALFNSTKCAVIKIGDSDQAIYNSSEDKTSDWVPQHGALSIMSSCRYSQEIADVICRLRRENNTITTIEGNTGIKPILLVFEPEKISRVISAFIDALETHELYDNKGVYKVIGAVRKESTSGLKIGSYWPEFDSSTKGKIEYNYWALVDDITKWLLYGKLYKAERIVCKLLCQIFHYAKVRHPISGKEYSVVTMKKLLNNECRDIYHQQIYEMSKIQNIEIETIDRIIRKLVNVILEILKCQMDNIFDKLPKHFFDKRVVMNQIKKTEKNIYIDTIRGRRIEFDTIHGVKGETHDATLYLETDRQGASDLKRILPYYGVGKLGTSKIFDYSRKLAYVGMSRSKKLLCVAMQAKTYEEGKAAFADTWEIIDLRNND